MNGWLLFVSVFVFVCLLYEANSTSVFALMFCVCVCFIDADDLFSKYHFSYNGDYIVSVFVTQACVVQLKSQLQTLN